MECEFCKEIFKTKQNLVKHQKVAKYCLKSRGLSYNCKFCNVNFRNNGSLELHQKDCVAKLKIEELEEEIKSLKKMIKDKKKVKLNNFPSQEEIDKIVSEKFTYRHFEDEIRGIARFCLTNILNRENPIYYCSDLSRRTFKFLENGNVKKDFKCSMFIESIYPEIIKKSTSYFDISYLEAERNYYDAEDDEGKANALETMLELVKIRNKILRIKNRKGRFATLLLEESISKKIMLLYNK